MLLNKKINLKLLKKLDFLQTKHDFSTNNYVLILQ